MHKLRLSFFATALAALVSACTNTPSGAFVSSVTPRVLNNATKITVQGAGLKGASVIVGGQTLTPISSSDTTLEVQIPTSLAVGDHRVFVVQQGAPLPNATKNTVNSVPIVTLLGRPMPQQGGSLKQDYDYVDKQVIVAFDVARTNDAQALFGKLGLQVVAVQQPIAGGSGICARVLVVLQGNTTQEALNRLANDGEGIVYAADPETVWDVPATHGFGASTATASQPLQAGAATLMPQAGQYNFRVAVLDTGVAPHVAIADVLDTPNARNFTPLAAGGAVNTSTMDDALERDDVEYGKDYGQRVGHGTGVAAIIAAYKDMTGVAAGVTILPVKVCDSTGRCGALPVAAGICHAIQQHKQGVPVRVMNLSLGGRQESQIILAALQEAAAAGISIVTSAGNEGCVPAPRPLHFPAAYSTPLTVSSRTGTLTLREGVPGLIAVAAATSPGTSPVYASCSDPLTGRPSTVAPQPWPDFAAGGWTPARFTSQGYWVTVAAPGDRVVTAKADGDTPSTYREFNGTSFAAPWVAGLAARHWAAGLTSPAAVKAKIEADATPGSFAGGCAAEVCGKGLARGF